MRAYAEEGDSAGSSEVASADVSRTSLDEENPGKVLDALLGSETGDEVAKGDIPTEGMLSVESAEVPDSEEGDLEELEVADGESVSDALIEGEKVSLLDPYPSLSALAKSVPDGTDDDRVRFVNEWLATCVRVGGALGNGVGVADRLWAAEEAVSAGVGDAAAMAFAFQAVMDELDIPCLCAQTADGSRVWNLVQAGGAWSHVDVAANAEAFAECDGSCAEEPVEGAGHRCLEACCLVDAEALGLPGNAAAFEAVEGFELPAEDEPVDVEAASKDSDGVFPEEGFDAASGSGEDAESEEEERDLWDGATSEGTTGGLLEDDAVAVDGPKLYQSVSPEPLTGSVATMATSYNASSALAYARAHWNDGVGLCAEFASNCLKAGGVNVFSRVVSSLYNAVKPLGSANRLTLSGQVCYLSSNSGKVSAGDPLFYYCASCGQWIHATICGGTTSKGTLTEYAHNSAKNNGEVYCGSYFGGSHGSHSLQLWAVHLPVSTHTHSHSVASYSYYHSYDHRVTYNKCSCGATKAATYEGHDFQWHGLTEKCTKCGAVYDKYTSVMEYFTNKQSTLYQGAGYNQTALKTIPAHTVVKPLESPRDYAAGRFQLKITYGGVTGYIWASDVTPNNSGGVHTWKNGVCTQCGVKQAPTDLGTYQITANKTAYKDNAMRGQQKQYKAGDKVVITKTEVSTKGWLWGWTDTGYTLEMNPSDMKYVAQVYRHGSTTTVPDGVYFVRSAANAAYNLDISGGSTADRANLQLYRDNGAGAQQFEFKRNADGTYTIKNVLSGKVLDVAGSSKASGANVWQYSSHGGAGQRWYAERTSRGTYAFRCKDSNLYLDITGGEVKNGGNIQQYAGTNTLNQQFYLEPVAKGSLAQQVNNVVSIAGFDSSYAYTGSAIAPKPTVRKRVWAADSLRVPVSGIPATTSNWVYRSDTMYLKGGRTYVLEVGAISHDAGSGTSVVALAYDFGTDKTVAPDMVFSYSTKTQWKTFTPTKDCTLIFYSGKNGACGGNVATWKNVRVYETLAAGTDYKVTYANNVNAGKATMSIAGIGSYSDVRQTSFTIKAKAATPTVTLSATSYTYNGKAKTPGVTVKVGGKALKSGTDYTVTYANNVKPGAATAKVTLRGNYSGSTSKTFTIKDNVPAAPASKSGWVKSAGGKWYLYQSGSLAKGWKLVSGTWYYLDPSTGVMATGWKKVSGAWYYLKDWGGMAEGWVYTGGVWYYLNPGSGAMAEGWLYEGGDWYYLTYGSGAMKTGWYQVGGTWYYSNSSGRMLANRWIDGVYWVGSSGAMATSSWVDGGRYWVGSDGRWVA